MLVVAAGGIVDGRGLAMALSLGAAGVWVGTRFVAAKEAGAPARHQAAVVAAGYHDTRRTIIYTGRPLRVLYSPYVRNWEETRQAEIKDLTRKGKIPVYADMEARVAAGEEIDIKTRLGAQPLLMGQAAGAVTTVQPAKEIIDDMMSGAVRCLRDANGLISKL